MGEVYRARDTRLGRDVAVKVLPGEVSHTPERLHRFEQEARLAGSLNHPNVLTVFDVGIRDGAPYLVTELLEGRSLREVLGDGPLLPRKAVDYAQQVARGLAAAHERGVVHRDIKPANLVVTKEGRVKVLDFGLAKLTQVDPSTPALSKASTETAEGLVVGTVGYMSPEQVRGQAVDARSDIFALGAVVYEMLSGRRAFGGDTPADTMTAILTKDPEELSRPGLVVPSSLDRIVRRCLEKDPGERFQSAKDVAFALEAESGTSRAEVESAAVRLPRWRRWVGAGVASLALLAAGIGARDPLRPCRPGGPSAGGDVRRHRAPAGCPARRADLRPCLGERPPGRVRRAGEGGKASLAARPRFGHHAPAARHRGRLGRGLVPRRPPDRFQLFPTWSSGSWMSRREESRSSVRSPGAPTGATPPGAGTRRGTSSSPGGRSTTGRPREVR